MGIKKVFKVSLLDGLNPKKVMSIDYLKSQQKIVSNVFRTAFNVGQKVSPGEQPLSFEECLVQYHISEVDLKKRIQTSLRTAYFALFLSLGSIAYLVYQIHVKHSISGVIMCFSLTMLLWAISFREHFNAFQMRERRLGCSLKEWRRSLFGKKS